MHGYISVFFFHSEKRLIFEKLRNLSIVMSNIIYICGALVLIYFSGVYEKMIDKVSPSESTYCQESRNKLAWNLLVINYCVYIYIYCIRDFRYINARSKQYFKRYVQSPLRATIMSLLIISECVISTSYISKGPYTFPFKSIYISLQRL